MAKNSVSCTYIMKKSEKIMKKFEIMILGIQVFEGTKKQCTEIVEKEKIVNPNKGYRLSIREKEYEEI